MRDQLLMPLWQQLLLLLGVPVLIASLFFWRELRNATSSSKRPMRKRKRKRH